MPVVSWSPFVHTVTEKADPDVVPWRRFVIIADVETGRPDFQGDVVRAAHHIMPVREHRGAVVGVSDLRRSAGVAATKDANILGGAGFWRAATVASQNCGGQNREWLQPLVGVHCRRRRLGVVTVIVGL